jgi:hypothetical protein
MKLERRHQEIASFRRFLQRVGRYTLFAVLLIVISLSIGTIGYHNIAKLSWIDSFYMASMILTGMGPVSDLESNAAKIFSSCFALYSGIAFISVTAVFFAPFVHRLLHILQVEGDDKAGPGKQKPLKQKG